MLNAQHKLGNLSIATQDCVFATFSDAGYSVVELLQPGMFDAPAQYCGMIPRDRNGLTELDQAIWLFVIAKDGPAIFVSDGFDEQGRLCFRAFPSFGQRVPSVDEQGRFEAEAPMLDLPKRPVGRPAKSRAA